MTGDSDSPERDPRTRRAWLIAVLTSVVGGGGAALLVGGLGASGRDGFRVFALLTALGAAVGGLYATATLLLDDLKGRHVGRSRVVTAIGLFVMTAFLMAMVAGIGG